MKNSTCLKVRNNFQVLSTLLLVSVFLLSFLSQNFLFALAPEHFSTVSVPHNPWQLNFKSNHDNYYVIDLNKNSTLFAQNAEEEIPAHLAQNLLLALLVVERLDPNLSLTVSQENQVLSKLENIYTVRLEAGKRYTLDYLLYSLIFYDSKAVFYVLAEAIAEDNNALADVFNDRARSLGMDSTEFTARDKRLVDGQSSLKDLSRLLLHTMSSNKLASIIKADSEVVLNTGIGRGSVLENRMRQAWVLSMNQIYGATIANSSRSFTAAYFAKIPEGQYDILIIQNSHISNQMRLQDSISHAIREAYRMVQEIEVFFERVTLVNRGDHVRSIVQQNGVEIDLIYLNTIEYLRPRNAEEFTPQMQLSVSNEIPLPISANQTLGQMVFTMPDGTRYSANVGSKSDIVSDNNLVSWLITQVKTYPDIVRIIKILFAVTIILLIANFIQRVIRYNYSRKSQNKFNRF